MANLARRGLLHESSAEWLEERRDYGIRYARSAEDRRRVQSLRFDVFSRELGATVVGAEQGLDLDPLDERADHLMVVERASGECVGTYRLTTLDKLSGHPNRGDVGRTDKLPGHPNRGDVGRTDKLSGHPNRGVAEFYTQRIFDLGGLDPIVLREGVELGRACVAVAHRTRGVFQLLLRGIGAHLVRTQKRFLFGCGSVPLKDPSQAEIARTEIEREGWIDAELAVRPTSAYAVPETGSASGATPEIPALLYAYCAIGARLAALPAYDRDFATLDFFVLLDLERVDPRTYARYCLPR